MVDNKEKIIRYVTGDMDGWEEAAFEAEMSHDGDLRLRVQLEQARMNNIRRHVAAALAVEDRPNTPALEPPAPQSGLRGVFKKLKTTGWRQWLAVAAISVGLAVSASLLCQQGTITAATLAHIRAMPDDALMWNFISEKPKKDDGLQVNAQPSDTAGCTKVVKFELLREERIKKPGTPIDVKEYFKRLDSTKTF